MKIVALGVGGATHEEITGHLQISDNTLKSHVRHIMQKTGRATLRALAAEAELIR
jgi:DNA-binding NarL/FixJ family response regulator